MDAIRPSHVPLPLARSESKRAHSSMDGETGKEKGGDSFYESLLPQDELDSEEEFLEGERHENELLQKYALWENSHHQALLEQLYLRLQPHMRRSEICYEFLALEAPLPFASSCPNGAVYFTSTLLSALSIEELLFLGAHELSHTELRHYASRQRRLGELRQQVPAPLGSPTRNRLDLAAILAVRHQEEFEADHQAAEWLGRELGVRTLLALHQLCRRLAPQSLNRPSHPPFEVRIDALKKGVPFGPPLRYLYSLVG